MEAEQARLEDGASLEGQGLVADPGLDLVFVYGSLKRGQSNHHWLTAASFQGEAQAPGLVLHDLGPFPMAIAAAPVPPKATESPSDTGGRSGFEGDGGMQRSPMTPIAGEVYAVDGETLAQLDRFEGVPRLYQRQRLQLLDGRRAWIYLGQPRQVRHVPALPQGHWPTGVLAGVLLTALAGALTATGLRAETSLAQCNRWQRSHGVSRIELGNQIGAASYLTKMHRLQQSPPEAPIALYAESDLERACEGAR